MANNKLISYNNLDDELKKMLMGVSPNTAQIENLLSNYFNKLSDKVTASLLHPSIEANFHNYSDAEDNKIKVKLNDFRKTIDPIRKSDLDSTLVTQIDNNSTTIAAINNLFHDNNGDPIDLNALMVELNTLKGDLQHGTVSASDLATAITNANNYTDSKFSVASTSLSNIQNDITNINNNFDNYRKKIDFIQEADLSVDLKNKLKKLDDEITQTKECIYRVNTYFYNVTIKINKNDFFLIKTLQPFSYTILAYVYDNNPSSDTYQQYINSEGIVTIAFKYQTFEDEFDDTSSSTSSTSSASSDKNYGIKIINTLDEDIYVRLVYSCSNELDDPIVSNIDTTKNTTT